jgi:L-ascorbate metabolism protein UlaG (beta-lactamase superfamily)
MLKILMGCLGGATTFRLKTNGLVIFLDTWIERPSSIPSYLEIDDIEECDYIFISHAHFDQFSAVPGSTSLSFANIS